MATWHELVIEGTEKTLRAFVAGFAGSHHVLFAPDRLSRSRTRSGNEVRASVCASRGAASCSRRNFRSVPKCIRAISRRRFVRYSWTHCHPEYASKEIPKRKKCIPKHLDRSRLPRCIRIVGPFEGVLTVWSRSHEGDFVEIGSFRVVAS